MSALSSAVKATVERLNAADRDLMAVLAEQGIDPNDALDMATAADSVMDTTAAMLYGLLVGVLYEQAISEATEDIPL